MKARYLLVIPLVACLIVLAFAMMCPAAGCGCAGGCCPAVRPAPLPGVVEVPVTAGVVKEKVVTKTKVTEKVEATDGEGGRRHPLTKAAKVLKHCHPFGHHGRKG
jgi:hypothetical protein